MSELRFYKYQGTGNDFVIIDNREQVFDINKQELITRLCDRKFGVGADGLILLNQHPDYEFEMVYFNADATPAMCGNGSRCAVHLAHHLGMIGESTRFLAEDGEHEAFIRDGLIHIKMVDVDEVQEQADGYFLNTGTRHFVRIVEDLAAFDVVGEGRKIRYDDRFQPQGTNANFTEMIDDLVHMRIYEKGVENETLSSGTGVTAVALAMAKARDVKSPVALSTRGGQLYVSFDRTGEQQFSNVYMYGPAEMVFEGTVFV